MALAPRSEQVRSLLAVRMRVWGDSLPGGPGAVSSAGRYLAVSRSPERISISRYWSDSVPLAGLSAARKAKKSCGAIVSVMWICFGRL